MTPTPTQVREALEKGMDGPASPIWTAVRAWLDLFTECEKCGGDGLESDHNGWTCDGECCPACGGRGYTLQPDRLEAAAADVHEMEGVDGAVAFEHEDGWHQDIDREFAEAAILAYLGEPR